MATGGGRSHQSKLLVSGAIEVKDGYPGRIRSTAHEKIMDWAVGRR